MDWYRLTEKEQTQYLYLKQQKKWFGLVHTSGSLSSIACKAFLCNLGEANTTFQGVWVIHTIFFLCSWLCTCARNKSACLLEVNGQLRCRREASGGNAVFRPFWGYSFPVPIPVFPMLWTPPCHTHVFYPGPYSSAVPSSFFSLPFCSQK